jgi:hypothetical protein
MKARFDWYAADVAIRFAQSAVFAAARHRNARKRQNVLKDIDAAIYELEKVRRILSEPPSVNAGATPSEMGATESAQRLSLLGVTKGTRG